MKEKSLLLVLILLISALSFAQDVIITSEAQKITAKILEVSKYEIKYKEFDNIDGPTFILETADINTIIYANGKVFFFKANENAQIPTEKTETIVAKKDYDLARAENYSGVYVFTDCTPLGKYEVLGDVTFGGNHSSTFIAVPNGMGGTTMIMSGGETPQYTSIRNGLIANAVMANRSVEGILIQNTKEGEGRATMIKFLEGEEKAKCKVNRQQGLYVFCDCKPIQDYEKMGEIVGAGGIGFFYDDLRNRLIKKVQKKYKSADGIILHLVEGGRDRAEAIQLE